MESVAATRKGNKMAKGKDKNSNDKGYDAVPTASGVKVFCAHDKIVDLTLLIPNPRNPNQHPDK